MKNGSTGLEPTNPMLEMGGPKLKTPYLLFRLYMHVFLSNS
jgi:hypothetical protein